MELLFNLIWVAVASATLFAWISWRRSSDSHAAPTMLRGLMVVVCLLAILFPVISISDDLSQMPTLVEGSRMQDMLKAPELRGIYQLSAVLPALLLVPEADLTAFSSPHAAEAPVSLQEIFWLPSVEKRPPPHVA